MANFDVKPEPQGQDYLKNAEVFITLFSQAWRDNAAKIHYGMGK